MKHAAVIMLFTSCFLVGLVSCRPLSETEQLEAAQTGRVRSWQPGEATWTWLDSGQQASLSEYRGKVLLLDFWATWCPPCRSEIPSLNRLHRELSDEGLMVIGMTVDRTPVSRLAPRVKELGLEYATAIAGDEVQRVFGGIRVVPTKIFIDRNGRVRDRVEGVIPEPELRRKLVKLLREG